MGGHIDGSRRYVAHTVDPWKHSVQQRLSDYFERAKNRIMGVVVSSTIFVMLRYRQYENEPKTTMELILETDPDYGKR